MIVSFKHKILMKIFRGEKITKGFSKAFIKSTKNTLDYLNQITNLNQLQGTNFNYKQWKGSKYDGKHCVYINAKDRLFFDWDDETQEITNVELGNYKH